MFWTDDNYNRVYRAPLDGSTSGTILVNSGLSCPRKPLCKVLAMTSPPPC